MLAEVTMLVALSVDRGPGTEACMTRPALERAVERRLKRRVFVTEAEAQLRLRVTFSKRGTDTEAQIEIASADGTPRGTRSLVTSGHCSALDDSLALSLALLVDEPPEPERPQPAAPGDVSKPAAAATPPKTITIPPEVVAPREPWRVSFDAGAGVGWGQLPKLAPAVVLGLELEPPRFLPIRLQGDSFWPSNAARDERSGARFHLLRVGLALCPALWQRATSRLGVCVGQKLGWFSAEGYGFDHDRTEQRLGYAISLGGEGSLGLFAPVSLRGYLGGELPLVRDRFSSGGRDATQLFEPGILAVSAEIGLEARLW